jgi:hypothetical protein
MSAKFNIFSQTLCLFIDVPPVGLKMIPQQLVVAYPEWLEAIRLVS